MIRVVIADDHELIRAGFARLASREADIDLVAEAETAAEVRRVLSEKTCDVLVLDISLPDESGLEVLRYVTRQHSDVAVLILSMHSEEKYALRSLQGGAAGYVTKGKDSRELLRAIRRAASGRRYLSESLAERLADSYLTESPDNPHERLSDRELQILLMIAAGTPSGDIAERLSLSPNTIQTYRRRLMRKLGAQSNADLVRYVMHHGLSE